MEHYNHIKDTIDISNESGPVTEPVTLVEVNEYLRINGFIDDNDSTSVPDFTDDDSLITELIRTARETLEEELCVSIVDHTWQAVGVTNEAGDVKLQYGPVAGKGNTLEVTSVKDSDDNEYDDTDWKTRGDYLSKPCGCDMTVEYDVTIATVPSVIKTEIKRISAYLYENRGDVDGLEGYKYSSGVMKYSRKEVLL